MNNICYYKNDLKFKKLNFKNFDKKKKLLKKYTFFIEDIVFISKY